MGSEHELSTEQCHALFHFLCHAEAFVEFTSLKIREPTPGATRMV